MTGMTELVKSAARIILPIVLMFGVYVMLHGEVMIGGGFAGGVLVASGTILVTLAFGFDRFSRLINPRIAMAFVAWGGLVFILLPRKASFIPAEAMIIASALSIGALISGALYSIFVTLASFRIEKDKEQ